MSEKVDRIDDGIKIGERVTTLKGCRIQGAFSGVVVGFSKWLDIPAVQVKKDSGKTVQCLRHNLILARKSSDAKEG